MRIDHEPRPPSLLLPFSLIVNLDFAVALAWVLLAKPAAPVASVPAPARRSPVSAPPQSIRIIERSVPPPNPFNWSQVESTNYFTYAQNLRNIGCPEQTIRDILQADLNSFYETRRTAIAKTTLSAARKENMLQQLEVEQRMVFTSLMHAPEQKSAAHSDPVIAPPDGIELAAGRRSPDERRIIDALKPLPLSEPEMTLVKNALKQYFDNSPPAQTPQEHARVWSDTQERIKTLLGYDRLNQYQEQLATSGTNSDPAALFQSSP